MNDYSREDSLVVEQCDDRYVIIISYRYDRNECNAIDYPREMDIRQ